MVYEREEQHLFEITCIAPDGIGFGDGAISALERPPKHALTHDQIQRAKNLLVTNRDRIVVPVDESDDGCGDGRPVEQIFRVVGSEKEYYHKSEKRAKIFGGGLQVAASMWRAVNGAPLHQETVLGDRQFIAGELKKRGITYGAHTDTHASGDNCGCGAIDKYELSVQKSEKYRSEITATAALFYDGEKVPGIGAALNTRHSIAQDVHYMSDGAGRRTMDFIEQDGAVVKELGDKHLEALVFMNDKPGTTVDQEEVAKLFREAGLPDKIQVFVVDVWRGRMYADAVAEIANATTQVDIDKARDITLADFFINQLSVAATLTRGDQPVVANLKTAA